MLSPEQQGSRNIQLLTSVIHDRQLMDQVPNGSSLLFFPENDPQLIKVNEQISKQLEAQGKSVTRAIETSEAGSRWVLFTNPPQRNR